MDIPEKGMTPRRANEELESAGQIGPEWRPPSIPVQLKQIWDWYYYELRPIQPDPPWLNYQELQAWAAVTHRTLDPFEVGVLRRLDLAFHAVIANPAGFPLQQGAPMMGDESIKALFRSMATKKESGFL